MWLLILLTLLFQPVFIYAQDATESAAPSPNPTPTSAIDLFNQYQKDYLFQYDRYQQDYLNYIDKKRVYTKYGTITTQKDKFNSAITAINSRNQAFKSYFLALRVLLDQYKSANPTATEKNQIELTKWENWFTEQIVVIPAINNEDDLQKWTTDFKNKYILIQQIIYASLVQHEINLRQMTLNKLQSLAEFIKNDPHIRPESQQWISSLTIKSDLINTSFNSALAISRKTQNQSRFSNFYPDARGELSKSNNYLREISADLKLIVTKFYSP